MALFQVAAEALREQIAEPSEELALAEAELAKLTITRRTLTRLTEAAEPAAPVNATIADVAYQKILAVFAPLPAGCGAQRGLLAQPFGFRDGGLEPAASNAEIQGPDAMRASTVE